MASQNLGNGGAKDTVEEKLPVQKELYLGITVDPSSETMKP
jgi:hypothetical protein